MRTDHEIRRRGLRQCVGASALVANCADRGAQLDHVRRISASDAAVLAGWCDGEFRNVRNRRVSSRRRRARQFVDFRKEPDGVLVATSRVWAVLHATVLPWQQQNCGALHVRNPTRFGSTRGDVSYLLAARVSCTWTVVASPRQMVARPWTSARARYSQTHRRVQSQRRHVHW